MAVGRALDAGDAGCHDALADQCDRAINLAGGAHVLIKIIDVFTLSFGDVKAVALERLADVVALEVVRGVTGDGDVVVINQQLDVEVLCDTQTCGFRVVTFLLAAIGAKHKDGLVGVGHRDAVDVGPHVPKSAGAELHARRVAALGVTGQVLVKLAVVEEFFDRQFAFEHGKQVLRRDAVAGLIEEDGQDIGRATSLGVLNKATDDHDLGHGVVWPTRVAGQTTSTRVSGKERDRIAAEFDVVLDRVALLVG